MCSSFGAPTDSASFTVALAPTGISGRRAEARVDGVIWIGDGLSAALGAVAGVGYRF